MCSPCPAERKVHLAQLHVAGLILLRATHVEPLLRLRGERAFKHERRDNRADRAVLSSEDPSFLMQDR